MAKITPVLWKHKQNKEGRSPIYLRISAGDKTKYKSLRVYIKPTHWNERSRSVRKSHKRHGEINALIAEKVAEAEGAVLTQRREGRPVKAAGVKEALTAEAVSSSDYFAFADEVTNRFRRRGNIYGYKRYKSVVKKFRAFAGKPLPFDEITPQLLRQYETHMMEHHGNKQSTCAANFTVIRAILYRAYRDGLAKQADNPFFHFKVKQGTPDRDKLTAGQLQRIEALDLEEGRLIWHVRNYFLFSLYGAGVRFGDVAKMQRGSVTGGRLVYQMSKTGHPVDLKLVPAAQKIARYYLSAGSGGREAWLFPILNSYDTSTPSKLITAIGNQNALVNKYLKKVANRAEIDAHLSFHVARHSFASIALKRGWDVTLISKSLGHSGLKVTENYLAGFDQNDLDDKMDSLFSGGGDE